MGNAILCLGSNSGDRKKYILNAENGMASKGCNILTRSSFYESEPWGTHSKSWYLNRVITIEARLEPAELHVLLLETENEGGRVRSGDKYSDRTIDIDLLYFSNRVIHSSSLQVPHPRLHLRKFVLLPLNEIEPGFIHPELNKSTSELLAKCIDPCRVVMYSSG